MAGAGRPTGVDERGLPQSMQKREAGSFAAPQKLHAVMQTPQAGNMAWAANIGLGKGGWQSLELPCGSPVAVRGVSGARSTGLSRPMPRSSAGLPNYYFRMLRKTFLA